jgi:hypothetical protein
MNFNKILISVLIYGIYLFSGCSNNPTKTISVDSLPQNSNNAQKLIYDNILRLAIEVDSIKIDGIPAFHRNKKDLIKKFGQPDSIANNFTEKDSGAMWEKIYWGRSSYMAFSVDKIDSTKEQFNIDRIDLNEGHEITINNMVINRNTTIKELKNIFPENYKLENIKNQKPNITDNIKLFIYVKTNKMLLDDSQIHFTVKKGKVSLISYSIPSI